MDDIDNILFKVIIAGSRGFDNYELLKNSCDNILQYKPNVEIVSGGARGADKLGEQYAKERKFSIKQFIPDWNIGKSAGYLRNVEMAKYGDGLIAFWDGKSKGTGHMIDIANERGLLVRVITF